jgi:hypothetical protein
MPSADACSIAISASKSILIPAQAIVPPVERSSLAGRFNISA